jgi:DNA (cytosine-5)-methyltransferase 1
MLADLILGHTPVCAVEWDPYCCAVLRERAAEGWFPGLHVHEGDVRLFDPSPWAGRVDCISAGFPCQDLSCAGRGEGIGGARSGLWVEVFRAADVIRPRWIFLENVPAIRTRGGEVVLRALRERGYRSRCGTLAAEDVGAPHRRERWWLLAEHADANGGRLAGEWKPLPERQGAPRREPDGLRSGRSREAGGPGGAGETPTGHDREGVADSSIDRREQWRTEPEQPREAGWLVRRSALGDPASARTCEHAAAGGPRGAASCPSWWQVEPAVGRVVDGLAYRVQRLKALGNGQVPLQAALAWVLLGGPIG